MRFFNNAGPIKLDIHYNIDPLERINKKEILSLIETQKYFILHAPRQTGKTSGLLALRDYLNAEGRYYCVYVNVEDAQAARENVEMAMQAIIYSLSLRIDESYGKLYEAFHNVMEKCLKMTPYSALNFLLDYLCKNSDKPLVLLIDEIDSLIGDTLISVLRQLRSGYDKRPKAFPQTIMLCGIRDVRDYRINSSAEKQIITGGSAFNIKSESLRLGDFTYEEVKQLYLQHTAETGQKFEDDIWDYVWFLTEGQPWIVNTLAYEACFKIEKDRTKPITKAIIEKAKENIIIDRMTHIDILIDKLREERVRRVIEPILSSVEDINFNEADISYVIDLGLIKGNVKNYRISNGIYKEVIPRELVYATQRGITHDTLWYVENGKLKLTKLLTNFQQFFRENSEVWLERFDYKEAGPHLLLMAFLQRIINGGGRIFREYGLGRKRIDLLIEYGGEKLAIETKIYRNEKTKTDGLTQLREYMDMTGAKEGHLVIFNRDAKIDWETKIYNEKIDGKITIWGI
ncbi:MAG: AAA-like domain-containing protein [Candidatus Wallbacteria bacterium]